MKVLSERTVNPYPVRPLCQLLGMTAQDYYKTDWELELRTEAHRRSLIDFVVNLREVDPGIGARKAIQAYNKEVGKELHIGKSKGMKWLSEAGLVKGKRRYGKPKTTDSNHDDPTYPNQTTTLVADHFGELMVADLTYIKLKDGPKPHCYLSLVMDSYTRMVLGWKVGDTMEPEHTLDALKMAIETLESRKVDLSKSMHHSDRGTQYACGVYTQYLKDRQIKISMTETGNPRDNAQAERVNGTFKNELFDGKEFSSVEEVKKATAEAVDFYNNKRPHDSLGGLTPMEAASGKKFKPLWKSKRTAAIIREKNKILVEFVQPVTWRKPKANYAMAKVLVNGQPVQPGGLNFHFRTIDKEAIKCNKAITPWTVPAIPGGRVA